MRKSTVLCAAILAAATYANVIDDSGKALKSGTLPTLAAKPADLLKVTSWVSKNCPRK